MHPFFKQMPARKRSDQLCQEVSPSHPTSKRTKLYPLFDVKGKSEVVDLCNTPSPQRHESKKNTKKSTGPCNPFFSRSSYVRPSSNASTSTETRQWSIAIDVSHNNVKRYHCTNQIIAFAPLPRVELLPLTPWQVDSHAAVNLRVAKCATTNHYMNDEVVCIKEAYDALNGQLERESIKQVFQRVVTLHSEDSDSRNIWCDKYKPRYKSEFIGSIGAINTLDRWIDDYEGVFYDSDASDDLGTGQVKYCCILQGEPGFGKSTALSLLCKSHSFEMIEVNSSTKRTAKFLAEHVLESTQSRKLSKCPTGSLKSIIVFDGLDTQFSDEGNLLGSIRSLICISRKPIVLLTTAPSSLDDLADCVVSFSRPDIESCVSLLYCICRVENYSIDIHEIERVVRHFRGDLRRILNQIQVHAVMAAVCTSPRMFDYMVFGSRIDDPSWIVERYAEEFQRNLVHDNYLILEQFQRVPAIAETISLCNAHPIDSTIAVDIHHTRSHNMLAFIEAYQVSLGHEDYRINLPTSAFETPLHFQYNNQLSKYRDSFNIAIVMDYVPILTRICELESQGLSCTSYGRRSTRAFQHYLKGIYSREYIRELGRRFY